VHALILGNGRGCERPQFQSTDSISLLNSVAPVKADPFGGARSDIRRESMASSLMRPIHRNVDSKTAGGG